MDCLPAKAKLAERDITILARTTPENRMLDGKRYYRAFPMRLRKGQIHGSARRSRRMTGAISEAH